MRLRMTGLILLSYFALVAATPAAPPAPIINIDAATLTPGPVASITNAGTQGGTFAALGAQTPVVETVAGKKAITFNGANGYKASFTAPDAVTGKNPWSVSTWIYNPTISTDSDVYFMWARRASSGGPSTTTNEVNGRTASLVYNSGTTWGAIDHYGSFAMAWGRLNAAPAAGVWHNITVTYDGAGNALSGGTAAGTGTECIYVDGVLISVNVGKPLDLFTGSNVLVALEERSIYAANSLQTPNQNTLTGLTGSIASLKMWNAALTADEVATEAGGATLNTGVVTDHLMNNSFEIYTYGGRDRNGGNLDGYWSSFATQGATTLYGGSAPNQYIRQTKFVIPGGSGDHWNNGDNVDGYHVLAMEASFPVKTYANQALFGIKPNTDYKVWGYFNARRVNGNKQILELKMNGVDILSPPQMEINVSDTVAQTKVTPFTKVTANWRSGASVSAYLSIGSVGITGNSYNGICCDKICIAEVGGPAKPVVSTKETPTLTSVDFYGVASGGSSTKTFRLFNDGGSDLNITGIASIGDHGYNYTAFATSNTVAPFGGMTDINVTFSPTAAGVFNNAQLKIMTNSTVTPVIYLPLTGYSVPKIANGSFEVIYANTGGGDVQASYPGWTTNVMGTNKIGFSYNNNWKWDNGNFAEGRQAATLNNDSTNTAAAATTMSQVVPGFVKGHNYRFRFYANSWKGTTSNNYDGKARADFKVNGVSATGVTRTPTGGTASTVDFPYEITNLEASGTRTKVYDKFEFNWTAPENGSYPIEFACLPNWPGDAFNSVLLDNVGVWDLAEAGPATVNTTRVDFGNKVINTTSTANVTFTNAGGKDLKVTTATFSGGQVAQFGPNTALPLTVPAFNGTANFSVKYMNTSFGQKDSTLTLFCDTGEKFIVALTANTTFAAYAPMLNNGSFDNDNLNKPTDVNNNNNAAGNWSVPGSNKTGRSWSGSQYVNNGIDPDGKSAMWIRKAAVATETWRIYQDVAGFRAGRTYRISLYANASAANTTVNPQLPVDGTAHLMVSVSKTDNTGLVNLIDQTITAVNGYGVFTTNWPLYTADYTATSNGTLRLEIRAGTSAGDNALLFDGVKIQEVAPGLQAAPTSIRFNTVNWKANEAPATATVTLTNAGLSALNLTGGATGTPGLAIVDTLYPTNPQFGIVSTTPASKASLAAGESMTVQVQFKPTYKGNYTSNGVLRITSNDLNLPTLDIPLAGDGVPVELSTFSVE